MAALSERAKESDAASKAVLPPMTTGSRKDVCPVVRTEPPLTAVVPPASVSRLLRALVSPTARAKVVTPAVLTMSERAVAPSVLTRPPKVTGALTAEMVALAARDRSSWKLTPAPLSVLTMLPEMVVVAGVSESRRRNRTAWAATLATEADPKASKSPPATMLASVAEPR